jgi:predicted nucleic acid-binding protein
LVDTNVVLDQLLQRAPWFSAAQPFWQARDAGRLVTYRAP